MSLPGMPPPVPRFLPASGASAGNFRLGGGELERTSLAQQAVQFGLQRGIARRDAVALAELQPARAGPRVDLEDDLAVAGVVLAQSLEILDHGGRQALRVDAQQQRLGRLGGLDGLRAGTVDLGLGGVEALDALDEERDLAALLVVDAPLDE